MVVNVGISHTVNIQLQMHLQSIPMLTCQFEVNVPLTDTGSEKQTPNYGVRQNKNNNGGCCYVLARQTERNNREEKKEYSSTNAAGYSSSSHLNNLHSGISHNQAYNFAKSTLSQPCWMLILLWEHCLTAILIYNCRENVPSLKWNSTFKYRV